VGELVGNPPREGLVAAVKKAIHEPHQLQELERRIEHLTLENKKVTEKVQKLKSECEGALKQVKESALTIQKIQSMVGIPGDVWLKAKMFDGELAKAGHLSGSKMVGFIMEQGGKLEATLRAMKALIASFAEMFPSLLESSESGETSSTYEDLTPEDLMEIEGAQGERDIQKVESMETVGEIPTATDPTFSLCRWWTLVSLQHLPQW
jgi:hypothetical protein